MSRNATYEDRIVSLLCVASIFLHVFSVFLLIEAVGESLAQRYGGSIPLFLVSRTIAWVLVILARLKDKMRAFPMVLLFIYILILALELILLVVSQGLEKILIPTRA